LTSKRGMFVWVRPETRQLSHIINALCDYLGAMSTDSGLISVLVILHKIQKEVTKEELKEVTKEEYTRSLVNLR
jgi:hypothetical protein